MPGRRDTNTLLVALIGSVVGVLVLLCAYLLQAGVDISQIEPESQKLEVRKDGTSDLTTALDKKGIAQFRETVSRPLFNPDRRPVQRDRAQAVDTAAAAGDMRLVGVVKLDRQPPRALIRLTGEASGKWIAEGEQVGGWKLRQVNERSVIVESGGRQHELTLQAVRRQADDTTGAGEPASKSR